MSANALKLIALFTMTLDHIGFCLSLTPLRMIGRLAMPIYCYLLVTGARRTRSPLRYALRLALFGLISELPFNYFVTGSLLSADHQSVYLTLLIGLVAILITDSVRGRMGKGEADAVGALLADLICSAVILVLALIASFLRCDYGAFGILMIAILGRFAPRPEADREEKQIGWLKTLAVLMLVHFLRIAVPTHFPLISYLPIIGGFFPVSVTSWTYLQLFSLIAVPIMALDSGKKGSLPGAWGKYSKWLFYAYYPAHLLILGLLFRL